MAKRKPVDTNIHTEAHGETAALFEEVILEPVQAAPVTNAEDPERSVQTAPETVHPGWPPGIWEEFAHLGPASQEFEDAVREWVPSPTWRDRVIDEYVEWANSPEANDGPESPASRGRPDDQAVPRPGGPTRA